MIDYLKEPSNAELIWYGVGFSAFTAIEITFESLIVKYISTSAEVVYSFHIDNKDIEAFPIEPSRSPTSVPSASISLETPRSKLPKTPLVIIVIACTSTVAVILLVGSINVFAKQKQVHSDENKSLNTKIENYSIAKQNTVSALIVDFKQQVLSNSSFHRSYASVSV